MSQPSTPVIFDSWRDAYISDSQNFRYRLPLLGHRRKARCHSVGHYFDGSMGHDIFKRLLGFLFRVSFLMFILHLFISSFTDTTSRRLPLSSASDRRDVRCGHALATISVRSSLIRFDSIDYMSMGRISSATKIFSPFISLHDIYARRDEPYHASCLEKGLLFLGHSMVAEIILRYGLRSNYIISLGDSACRWRQYRFIFPLSMPNIRPVSGILADNIYFTTYAVNNNTLRRSGQYGTYTPIYRQYIDCKMAIRKRHHRYFQKNMCGISSAGFMKNCPRLMRLSMMPFSY